MTDTKVSNNNPDKESLINKSKTKTNDSEFIKNKTTQNINSFISKNRLNHLSPFKN